MLTIYHAAGTRSMRVIWLCHELDLPLTIETVPFTAEFRASDEWRAKLIDAVETQCRASVGWEVHALHAAHVALDKPKEQKLSLIHI